MKQLKYQIRYALPLWLTLLVTAWLPDNRIAIRLRGFLASLILPGRPKGFTMGRDVTLLGVNRLKVGPNSYFAKGVWINALGGVSVGAEVMLSPYVVIASTKHGFKNNSVVGGGTHFAPIAIGRGSWVAAHATISAGVSVGEGCIVGANSLVLRDIPANVVAIGVPAAVVKARIDNPGRSRE